jgi:hypothetical protein
MQGFYFVSVATNRSRQLMFTAAMWLTLVSVASFLFFFNPASPSNQFFPKCPFRFITGLQCPGCGSTRAFYQLLHFHPVAAFKLNPLFILTLPFLVYGFLGYTKSAVTGRPYRRVFIPAVYLWGWLSLMIFFWIFRNTPWYPFVS